MRYYRIVLTNPTTGQIVRPKSLEPLNLPATWCTTLDGSPTGINIPAAQNIELDISVFAYAEPISQGFLRIWGIALDEIAQATNLVGYGIAIYAGMGTGLPLVNPSQAGLIVRGQVYQALGNWENIDQTLDLFITPPIIGPSIVGATEYQPPNLVLVWQAGQPLANALQQCLATAFPNLTPSISISSDLVQDKPDVHVIPNLTALAEWVRQKSLSILNPDGKGSYLGVAISIQGSTIKVFDKGVPPPAGTPIKIIAYNDLIGQPTWIDAPYISMKTVLRSDINVGDYVNLPPGLSTATSASLQGSLVLRGRPLSFQGNYQVRFIRHVGNFRQADGASWCTIFNAYPVGTRFSVGPGGTIGPI